MEKLKAAINAVNVAMETIATMDSPDRTKAARIRKLTQIKAELVSECEKEKILATLPERKPREKKE